LVLFVLAGYIRDYRSEKPRIVAKRQTV